MCTTGVFMNRLITNTIINWNPIGLYTHGQTKTILTSDPELPSFSLMRDFGKQNTRGNVSKISVGLTGNRHIGSKYTYHSPLAWRREGQKVTLVAVIGGFRSDLSITRKTDGNFENISACVLFSIVAYLSSKTGEFQLSTRHSRSYFLST